MVDHRRLRRLKLEAQQDGVVLQLRDGSTSVFSKHTPLEFCVACWEEGMAAEEGVAYTWHPELERFKKALQNATPESRAGYDARYGGMFRWEESSAW